MPRKKPNTESEDVLQIRCMWETVSVFQFVGLFRSKFQFTQFDLEDFEYSLAQEESILVADIFARLLRFSLQRTDIQIFNWEGYIQRFIQDRAPRSKDFLIKFPYRGLNPSDRLLLLKQVVDTVNACHAEDLTDYLDDYYSPNDMRFLSIGQDAVNNQYWYFNDLRLYKDQVSPKKGKSAWQCICSCLEEWQAFLKTICKSRHPDEISLYHYLHDEVIPIIQGALEDKKLEAKQRRKRLKQAAKEGKEADVLREYSLPKVDYQEVLRREREDIEKMSDELTKLAQLANSADLQVTTQTLHSPSLPTIKEEGMMRKRLEDNGLQGDSDLAAKMCIKADKKTGRNKMIKESDEDDSVFLPDHAGNGPEATKDEKVPPRSKRKSEAKVKEMDWCSNDADNIKMNKVNGDKNQVSDGAGISPHVMQYQQPSHFAMAGGQQVFVFSTRMANQAAQAIYTGQADSILSYHRSQAAHRDYLHPEQDTLPDTMHPQDNMPTRNPQLTTLNQVHPMMMDPNNSNPMQGMLMNQQVQHQSIPHHQAQPQVMDTVNNEHANVKTSGGRKCPDRPNSINTDSNNPSKNQTASHKNVTSDGNTGKQSDSNVTTTTVTTKSSKSKSSKRKRPPSSSQQLQPNMTQGPHLSNMPPASNFGTYPQQPFGPGQFPPHPQQIPGIPNMGMRPPLQGTPPQSGPLFQMEATETENLDPSALWENPPCNKKTPNLANLAWQQEQQMRMMQQQQGSGSQLPMMQHQQSSMMSPCHETMMTNRPYSEGSQSQEHSEMAPFSPASGPGMPFEMTNYKPPQQIDNPTPEQLRHREERLRTLKEMQRLLFPEEHQTRSPTPGRLVSPSGGMGSPQGNMMTSGPGMMRPPGPAGMMGPQQRPIMHLPNMGPHPNMDNPDPAMGLSPEHRMAQEQIIMPPPPDWDNMTPPQKEWYKLQHEFYALKRRKIATEQIKIGHGAIPELHGAGYRDPIDMGPYHHGIGLGMGPGPGIGPGVPHGLPGDPGLPPTISRCMPGADTDVSNQGTVGPGMTGSGMPGMPGQGMPMPDMPGQTGQGMPPPPPYHGTHNAATPTMPRRSSLSGPGTLAMNQSTPFPMSPHHIPSGQPSPRSNRTNSLPASGSVPPAQGPTTSQLPTGQVPTGNELKSSLITSGKVATAITSGSNATGPVPTSGSSATTGSVTIGSQQISSTQPGPVSRQPMSPQQGSPFRPSHQPPTPTSVSTPNTPVGDSSKASKARTPGNSMDQSPRPPQSGTPAGDTNVQSVVRISQAGGSQPGTPNSAPNNGSRQSVSTPSSLTPPTAKSNSESSNAKPSDGPNAQIPSTQKPSESVAGGTNTSAPQQRLVNFPPSQLNRDKAPNFPPRGEDLQQYASTFYQKASKESSKSSGRLQHFGPGSPVGPEMMGQTGENMSSQTTMMRSQPDNSQPQIMAPQQRMMTAQNSGISQPESVTTQTGVMPLQPGMMTSQSGIMTSQPGMMTSQPGMMTSQSGMMTSQSGMMTSQSGMMTSQPGMMTSQPGMMTQPRISTSQEMSSHPCMMSPQSGPSVADKGSSHLGMISHSGMVRPQHPEMMTHGIMTSQQEMMASHPAGMSGMMSPQPNIMTPHDAMHHPPGMMQTRMPTSQQMMSQANMGPRQGLRIGPPHGNPCMPPEEIMLSHGNMTSQPGMMMSHGGMVTSQAGMMSQQRMMSQQPTMMQHQGMTAQTRMASRSPIIESHGMGFDHHHPMDGPMGFHPMHGNMLNNTGMQDMRGMHSMPNRFPGPKQMQRNLGGAPPTMGHSVGPMGRTSGMPPGGSPIMHIDGNPRESNLMQSESKPISQSQVGRTIHTSSPSPLSLLQSRFSPPLLPDGKGPKQTLQYFPQGNPTPAPQAQSGNPHLNPSNATGPQGPAPKQIQMPFPLEMVTGNPPSMTPSFGPSQRMPGPSARMCGPESVYPQGYPASNRPRQQLPGYVGTPRHTMQYSGPPMGMPMSNTMGQQMPYPPGYGPHGLPGSNMGMGDSIMHGYNNMPK